jgi:uncharacterized protein (DUF1697 family)
MIGPSYGTLQRENQIRGMAEMPVFVAMLRGVNVGGNPLKMEWLREACAELGFSGVRTYLQTGNVVLSSGLGAEAVAKKLKATIDGQTRLPVPVVVRTASEMEKIVAGNPFLKQKGIDATKLHVTFLEHKPAKPDVTKLDKLAGGRDEYRLARQEVYLHCPINYGQSKLTNTAIEKILGSATTRNWNTVTVLNAMANE